MCDVQVTQSELMWRLGTPLLAAARGDHGSLQCSSQGRTGTKVTLCDVQVTESEKM
jgi:hypothetical protein